MQYDHSKVIKGISLVDQGDIDNIFYTINLLIVIFGVTITIVSAIGGIVITGPIRKYMQEINKLAELRGLLAERISSLEFEVKRLQDDVNTNVEIAKSNKIDHEEELQKRTQELSNRIKKIQSDLNLVEDTLSKNGISRYKMLSYDISSMQSVARRSEVMHIIDTSYINLLGTDEAEFWNSFQKLEQFLHDEDNVMILFCIKSFDKLLYLKKAEAIHEDIRKNLKRLVDDSSKHNGVRLEARRVLMKHLPKSPTLQ
jgi:hypothetical protein